MAKIKPIKVNIVEEEGWKDWDYATDGGIRDWSSDNAWDDWRNMEDEALRGYIEDLIKVSLNKAEQRKITPEDVDRIMEEVRESTTDHFETLFHAINDAHVFAWEVAYSPDDRDIEKALEKAKRNWDLDFSLSDYWKLVLHEEKPEGPREWSPRGWWTEGSLFKDLVDRIHSEHKSGYYDRFLVFDWGTSEPVEQLLEALKKHPEEGNRADVENDLKDWSERFLTTFFRELQERMQDNDPNYHWDLDPHWKSMLKDKAIQRGVREEILEFLAKPKKEEVE